MALRRGHIFVKGGVGGGQAESVDDGLEIVVVLLERKQKRVSFIAAKRAGEGTLFHVAAFGRLGGSKSVAGIENGIAGEEIHGAVIRGRAAFGGDFNAGAAAARESRGIGILIDFYFLDRGSGNAGAVGLDTVDDKRYTAGGDGVVAEEAGEEGDVVEIEDGDAIEGVAGHVVGVEIFGGVGGSLRDVFIGSDAHNLTDRGDGQRDMQRSERLCAYSDINQAVLKPGGVNAETILAVGQVVEEKVADAVGSGGCLN